MNSERTPQAIQDQPVNEKLVVVGPTDIAHISSENISDTDHSLRGGKNIQISGFNTDKIGGRPNACFSLDAIFNRIQFKPSKPRKTRWGNMIPSQTNEAVNAQAVTFAGKFESDRRPESPIDLSGLICFGFQNLSPARLSQLRSELAKDKYSYAVFDYPLNSGLKVIVCSECSDTESFKLFFVELLNYYRSTYNIKDDEIDMDGEDVCHLCYLPYDPNIAVNPSSELLRIKSSERGTDYAKPNSQEIDTADLTPNSITAETNREEINETPTDQLSNILQTEQRILRAASQNIIFKPALVSRLDVPVIRNGTINVIQGKQGQHKSRLAEMIVSLLVAKDNCETDFLGFERMIESVMVCYLDTERNIDEECANSLQSIRQKAGYGLNEHIPNLRFMSLKQDERSKRLKVVDQFLHQVRQSTNLPLFVVLDVVTDCIRSFNSDQEAMHLFDSIHRLCETHNATFLLVIHENPTSEKARGHAGTEAANKASTVLQIGVEDREDNSPLIKINYIKLRGNKRPDPVYLQLDENKQFILADEEIVTSHITSSKQKINPEQLAEALINFLAEKPMPKGSLYKELRELFGASDSLVRQKVTKLMDDQLIMISQDGKQFVLAETENGRQYFLQTIK